MPLVRVKERYQVTIPYKLRKALGIEQGDYLEAEIKDKAIVLIPRDIVDKDQLKARSEAKKEFFEIVDRVQKRNKDLDPSEVEEAITEAVEAVRSEKWKKSKVKQT